jgi:molybdenum cofactor cytidylyltransferase
VLAAGSGVRFGGHKLLARLDGRPLLQHVLDLAATVGLAPLVVVLGDDAEALISACRWRGELRLVNPDPAAGISSSVKVGLNVLEHTRVRRAVILLADQPYLARDQLDSVLQAAGPVVIPRYAGVPGNPVVLERSVWPLAASLSGDRGFSQLFASHPDLVTYVDLPGANPDIDTPADLAAARPESHQIRQLRGRKQQQ